MKFKKPKAKSKILNRAKIIAEQVLQLDSDYSRLTMKDLAVRTKFLIDGLATKKFLLEDILVDAFAIARESIFQVHKQKAFPVQIMGAYVAHSGDFAEMFTGEGKSLTILLVAFVNALRKKGVHIVTVNEYLVQRDAEFANQVFEQLGITVGYNTSKMSKEAKREMFAKDITYTTNAELGFDYLRDNLVRNADEKVIRDLDFVIVDEGDSVLIDEARTPLIISGMPKEDLTLYIECDNFVSSLTEEEYAIDHETNSISLTPEGTTKAEQFFNIKNLYSVNSSDIVHKITNALTANYVFANGREYIVQGDKIQLVDQFTGRILEGRSYNAGLQQAIQAKEKVKIEPENIVMATITYQSFFRLYKKLSAVSGTALTESEEFLKIYNMVVVEVPTNRPIVRIDQPDYIFGNKNQKWSHVIQEIANRHKKGQPILVGTASVTDSELISRELDKLQLPHQVLNARDNTREADIVKLAGQVGAITISTNMAGRGTDIKVSPESIKLGGLYVIGTERHESRRIDNQLRGRTGRQGDVGESRFFTSLEDSLFKRFATDRFEKASKKLDDDFYDSRFFSKMLDKTQRRVEGLNFDIRKNLMDYDHVLSLQRELIYKQRDQILFGNSSRTIIFNMSKDLIQDFTNSHRDKSNSALIDDAEMIKFLNETILRFSYFDLGAFSKNTIQEARAKLYKIIVAVLEVKWASLEQMGALKLIDEILLTNLDTKWTQHIDKMTKLREGVNLRSLEQRLPLNIYIEDGNVLFENMKFHVVEAVFKAFFSLTAPNEKQLLIDALNKIDLAYKSESTFTDEIDEFENDSNFLEYEDNSIPTQTTSEPDFNTEPENNEETRNVETLKEDFFFEENIETIKDIEENNSFDDPKDKDEKFTMSDLLNQSVNYLKEYDEAELKEDDVIDPESEQTLLESEISSNNNISDAAESNFEDDEDINQNEVIHERWEELVNHEDFFAEDNSNVNVQNENSEPIYDETPITEQIDFVEHENITSNDEQTHDDAFESEQVNFDEPKIDHEFKAGSESEVDENFSNANQQENVINDQEPTDDVLKFDSDFIEETFLNDYDNVQRVLYDDTTPTTENVTETLEDAPEETLQGNPEETPKEGEAFMDEFEQEFETFDLLKKFETKQEEEQVLSIDDIPTFFDKYSDTNKQEEKTKIPQLEKFLSDLEPESNAPNLHELLEEVKPVVKEHVSPQKFLESFDADDSLKPKNTEILKPIKKKEPIQEVSSPTPWHKAVQVADLPANQILKQEISKAKKVSEINLDEINLSDIPFRKENKKVQDEIVDSKATDKVDDDFAISEDDLKKDDPRQSLLSEKENLKIADGDPFATSEMIKKRENKQSLEKVLDKADKADKAEESNSYDLFENDISGDFVISKIVDKYEKEILEEVRKNSGTQKLSEKSKPKDFNADLIASLKKDFFRN